MHQKRGRKKKKRRGEREKEMCTLSMPVSWNSNSSATDGERCADSFHGWRRSDCVPWTSTSANRGGRIANSFRWVFLRVHCANWAKGRTGRLEGKREDRKRKVFCFLHFFPSHFRVTAPFAYTESR
ncbi:hypothetical protein WH47_11872 [Habropoda laboriosa]|uniref:Uncharacterized protein n=1 Tax=Habropoda laboriosa TaxID=597456 RepID=A0A0L7R8L7_9HYME|nr:hypothetical protein WH47_11872 [Habropoda laboriosa]